MKTLITKLDCVINDDNLLKIDEGTFSVKTGSTKFFSLQGIVNIRSNNAFRINSDTGELVYNYTC